MSKVITFSRTFPAYHPKAGQQTYFVNKLLKSFPVAIDPPTPEILALMDMGRWIQELPKHHTIRTGSRWKVGDKFSPRIWSGKPYQSKQIIIAPDIEIKKVYSFDKDLLSKDFYLSGRRVLMATLHEIAKNDGLELADLLAWFKYPKPFTGQIICWNENVNY